MYFALLCSQYVFVILMALLLFTKSVIGHFYDSDTS